MKAIFRISFFPILLLVAVVFVAASNFAGTRRERVPRITEDSYTYRDLNKNGKLDPYEDSRQPVEKRIDDLIAQMNIEEKAGMMFINGVNINDDGTLERKPDAKGFAARLPTALEYINGSKMNHFNYWQTPGTRALADGYNAIQKAAENTRLGIPVTIASDPRHYFSNNIFTMAAGGFSQWPEQLGFAAIGDEKLMREFADVARQEYAAVGIREALHPMADLATEPRWARISGTFGEDAQLSAKLIKAMGPVVWPARAWGVEGLSREDRVKKIIEAGCDQFGGENCPELVVSLVKSGKLSEQGIDQSIRRLLRQKFVLGLFDSPFVDAEKAVKIVGKTEFMAAGEAAQRRSFTLLKNEGKTLPLQTGRLKIYVKNLGAKVAANYGQVVDNPKDADIAIVRLNAPWYPVETQNPFAKGFHHGDLDFKGKELEEIIALMNAAPTVVDIYLDRPAVIPEIGAKAKALLANYGASDAALLDVVFGKAKPEGKLPFELPSSMEAVRNQKEDVPYDSKNPLYKFGHGLSY